MAECVFEMRAIALREPSDQPHARDMDRLGIRDDARKNPDVIAYLDAENRYTEAVMKPLAPLVQKLYEEMKGRIKETDLSVPALAKRVGKSPRHLTRVFRKELGIAPAEAVEQLRLEAARRALQQSPASLEEVAARCGFGSAEVLRRAFLRALHVTPSAYRARFSASKELAS